MNVHSRFVMRLGDHYRQPRHPKHAVAHCDCPDFKVTAGGWCKHVAATMYATIDMAYMMPRYFLKHIGVELMDMLQEEAARQRAGANQLAPTPDWHRRTRRRLVTPPSSSDSAGNSTNPVNVDHISVVCLDCD